MARLPHRRPGWRTLLVPALLALATAIGLAAGLLGDGAADRVAWAALLLPVLALGLRRAG